jgi:hypothetical protein
MTLVKQYALHTHPVSNWDSSYRTDFPFGILEKPDDRIWTKKTEVREGKRRKRYVHTYIRTPSTPQAFGLNRNHGGTE